MERIENVNSRLEAIQQELNKLEYEKREKSYFITLEILKLKKVELNNLKEELLNFSVNQMYETAKRELFNKLTKKFNDLEENIKKIETNKEKFKKISNKQLYIINNK
jgi:hypothetical protein